MIQRRMSPTHPCSADGLAAEALRLLKETASRVSRALDCEATAGASEAAPVLRHALRPGGLRERALLVRLGWEVGAHESETILSAMVAVELLHFSTLVIDDWFDESPLRGGHPTVMYEFGPKEAVITGEILSAAAIRALLGIGSEAVSARALLAGVRLLERVREEGYVGQWLDLSFESRGEVTEDEYFEMIDRTTGLLAETAVVLGATLRDAPRDEIEALSRFGRCFGMAQQIRNDISELVGDPELIGRRVGEDLMRGKKRLPWLHALSHGPERVREPILRVLGNPQSKPQEISAAVEAMRTAGSIDYCLGHIGILHNDGVAALGGLPDCHATRALRGLMDIVAYSW